ncbi:of chromosomes protein 3 [Seminavis robusta]|uniref:Structural maintenance of chromosomes protein n=1 Tax=Seminavis robusta TaxID=568900 RepID=A0A9N8E298_9STRA|nr:of chromosomes protein 3 [Seminavis robusta]|eukprot:Sro546_g163990.1 of chromosomes protein 3 (1280) ;mRNA; r:3914-8061
MHIKQITIFNFRSFSQQPEIHPFSPGTNSVVGRNGSGKSNLFDAVQFVLLAPRFYSLRQEERQALLHEGAGSAAVNAFVEVVFDNSDHRFIQEPSDEVVLRRTIGPKKDEFFLQRKRATKQEISSLLEGAGFSKSNPYFMIQQGKIQDICTMRDNERLSLLKQVAGTTVYDEKKQESLTKMEENIASIDKITNILQEIEQRLTELHGEKDELSRYQQLDRQRRAIEYTLYDKELRKARKSLDSLENERVQHASAVRTLHEQLKQTQDAIRNVEAVMTTKSNALKRHRNTLKALEADKTVAVQQYTSLKLECEELQDSIQSAQSQQASNQQELVTVQAEIAKAQAQLTQEIQPNYEKAAQQLQQMTHDKSQKRHQMEALIAKQGRGSHFQTKQERDAYLEANIQELLDTKAEKESSLQTCRETVANLRRSCVTETNALETLKQQIATKKEQQQTFHKTLDDKKLQRLQAQEKRQEQWRQTDQLQEQMRETKENHQRRVAEAQKVMPRATALGLEALERIVRQEGLTRNQYFGMLMDNFTLTDPKYQTAVEVAAQNSLFHVIVDNDGTAARLMKRLEDGKLGRVTFLPLNRLRVDRGNNIPNNGQITALLDLCVTFDPAVKRAIEHVFNQKIIARDIDSASEWSAKLQMDAITLDGDLAGRKGALTGGYHDANKSRLRAHYAKKETTEAFRKAEREFNASREASQKIDQQSANVMQEMERLEAKNNEMQRQIKDLERDADKKRKWIDRSKKQEEKAQGKISPLELEVSGLDADIGRLQDEMKTELTSTLSDEEKQLLVALKKEEKKLKVDVEKQTDVVSRFGVQRQRLQSLLEDNLLIRQRELQGLATQENDDDDDDDDGFADRSTFAAKIAQQNDQLQEKRRELDSATRVMNGVEERITEARQVVDNVRAEMVQSKNELERLKSHDAANKKSLETAQDEADRMLNKRTMCVSKRETYATKIQELGALPPQAERQEFANKSISDLMKQLEGVNKKLKKYSHVNKKAYDQYVSFSEKRDELLKRKDELDRNAEKVTELVESLDRQKDEAINRTFRGVSAHFKDVFKELVPLGQGELVMRTNLGEEAEESDGEDGDPSSPGKKTGYDPKNPDVSLYRGVGVKVRFSPVGENFMMSQLSGGQKALVALALIFSIQRCDPAPFYIFDELDQALDSAYRASVANLIQKQANSAENPTQFIVSTFRPELVAVADQCYGISHQSKVSRFHHMTKKDSLAFIANLMTEEENVGEVTTVSNVRTRRPSESRKRKASSEAKGDEDDAVEEA